MDNWPDAYSQHYDKQDSKYRRIPLRRETVEPIDDYDLDSFFAWVEMACIFQAMRSKNRD